MPVCSSDKVISTASKLYKTAQEDPQDEEKMYILLRRFLEMYKYMLCTTNDPRYIQSMLNRESRLAADQVEELRSSLNSRYVEEIPHALSTPVNVNEADQPLAAVKNDFNEGNLTLWKLWLFENVGSYRKAVHHVY